MNQPIQTTKYLLTLLITLFCDVLVMAQAKNPANIGETQDVPNVKLPIHDLLINQDANDAASSITQTISLAQGWNWFSPYVEADDPVNMLVMLEEGLGDNADIILSMEDGMTEYDGEEWFGDLDDVGLVNTQMYMVLTNADCTVEMEGVPADLTEYEISIKPGWNWIGFPSAEALDVVDALADFAAEEGDIILSQNDGMTEYDGEGWFGDLETLEPGIGMMYFNSTTETKTLVYSTDAKAWVKCK